MNGFDAEPPMPWRQRETGILANANRRRLLALVQENPAMCIQEVADRLGVTRTAAGHHVRRLIQDGLLVAVRQGRRVLHFPPSVAKPAQRSMLGLLRLQTVRAILGELKANPSLPWRELARRIQVSPHTIRWHMQRLQSEGLVHVMGREDGEGHVAYLHPDLRGALEKLPPAEPAAVPEAGLDPGAGPLLPPP